MRTYALRLHRLISYDSPSQEPNRGVEMGVVRTIFLFFRVFITSRSTIAAENLALRSS